MKKYWNGQRYFECQLVAIWNAAIYHRMAVPVRYGKEYTEDCEKAYAVNGGCIDSNHVVEKLHLQAVKGNRGWNWIKKNCPIEFKIHCHRGYHSVLAVDINIKSKKVALANYAEGRLYWVTFDRLLTMLNKRSRPIRWCKVN